MVAFSHESFPMETLKFTVLSPLTFFKDLNYSKVCIPSNAKKSLLSDYYMLGTGETLGHQRE